MGFDATNWQEHPCVVSRPANEQDVKENRATFYVPGSTIEDVYVIACPQPAMLKSDKRRIPVLILHAQLSPNQSDVVAGVIDPLGNHYVSLLTDLEPSEVPTDEWTSAVESSQ